MGWTCQQATTQSWFLLLRPLNYSQPELLGIHKTWRKHPHKKCSPSSQELFWDIFLPVPLGSFEAKLEQCQFIPFSLGKSHLPRIAFPSSERGCSLTPTCLTGWEKRCLSALDCCNCDQTKEKHISGFCPVSRCFLYVSPDLCLSWRP